MPLKLNSSSGGSVTLQEPTTASNRTLTLPDATGTVIYSDASGNVGIGSTPSVKLTINQGSTGMYFRANASTADRPLTLTTTTTTNNGDTHTLNIDSSTGIFAVATNGTERNRTDFNGNFYVGTTTSRSSYITTVCDATYNGVTVTADITGARTACSFRNPNGAVGSITTNGTATAYNTSSDYRLKEDVKPMTGALAKVAALKPVTYKWKTDGSDGEGFIAHELAEVSSGCVTGEKDAIDANGDPIYQGIDTSFLVATLTAAIQEQQAMIEELKAKVAALEAK